MLLSLCDSQPALCVNVKKATTAAIKNTKKIPSINALSGYVKADFNEVEFKTYSDSFPKWSTFIVKIGETFEMPHHRTGTGVFIRVKSALVNPLQPQNAAVDIDIFTVYKKIFSGYIYQNYPEIDPFALIARTDYYYVNNHYTIKFVTGHPSIHFTPQLNRFSADKNGVLYFLYNQSLYYKTNESGDDWSRIVTDVRSFVVNPVDEKILYSIKSVKDYNGKDYNGIEKSMNGGKEWVVINNGLPSNVTLFELVINPHNPQEVFVLSSAGMFKTNDAGFSWDQTNLGKFTYQLLIHPKEKSTFYANTNTGLYITKDAGVSWSSINNSLPKRTIKGKGRTARILPIGISCIAFSSYEKPSLIAFTDENGILKTKDNGLTWQEFNNGFNKKDGANSINTVDSGVYIGCYNSIYYIKDDSDKWTKISFRKDATPPNVITGIYYLPKTNNEFIITDSTGRIMYVDQNHNLIGLNYGVLPHSNIKNIKSCIVNGQQRIYAFLHNNNYSDIDNEGLFYSTDNGRVWHKNIIYSDRKFAENYFDGYYNSQNPDIYISPLDNTEMRLISGGTTKYTENAGNSWTSFDLDLGSSGAPTHDFIYDPTDKNIYYSCNGVNGSWLFKYKNNDTKTAGKWISLNVEADTIIVNSDDNNKLLTNFLKLSLDGGWTWKYIVGNINTTRPQTFIPISFKGKSIIIAAIRRGKNLDAQVRILETDDMGGTWTNVGSIKNVNIFEKFYVNPNDINNLFIVDKDSVLESVDKGTSWKTIFKNVAPENKDIKAPKVGDRIESIAVFEDLTSKAIYLGTNYGLIRSYDHGMTWQTIGGIK